MWKTVKEIKSLHSGVYYYTMAECCFYGLKFVIDSDVIYFGWIFLIGFEMAHWFVIDLIQDKKLGHQILTTHSETCTFYLKESKVD